MRHWPHAEAAASSPGVVAPSARLLLGYEFAHDLACRDFARLSRCRALHFAALLISFIIRQRYAAQTRVDDASMASRLMAASLLAA